VVGVFVDFAFDAAFEVFHRLFFPAGSYTFDPRTDKLVQLFPEAFWSETAIFVGVAILVAAIATWWFARRRAAG
jgi:integral membrane protein (TIGR01906 family)